jgi:hypothetical protein
MAGGASKRIRRKLAENHVHDPVEEEEKGR